MLLRQVSDVCPACGALGMRLLSGPRPEYVEQCTDCGSAFFRFGQADVTSHNEQYNVDSEYQRYLESANETSLDVRYKATLEEFRVLLSESEDPSIFDVGAGGGNFLAMARQHGFRIAGNEVSQPAIDECRQRHGIDLLFGDNLEKLAAEHGQFDAVTMWCVIAHVDDPVALLHGVRSLLKPGGILFFSTPRYCAIDRLALAMRLLTRDRYRRVFDRRINQFHRRQYTRKGMEALLGSAQFTPLVVKPMVGYGLHMQAYLQAVGMPRGLSKFLGACLDVLAKLGILPRNILSVYARK